MDNVQLNSNVSAGAIIATDDVGGAQHQYVKVEFGVDGVATPVSATNPLPITGTIDTTGLATSALQTTGNASLASIDSKLTNPLPVSGTVTITGVSTEAKQDVGNASLSTIAGKDFATETTLAALNAKVVAVNTGAVVVSSSALPTGAATEATLLSIKTGTAAALGQDIMVRSVPVVIASDQSPIPITYTPSGTQDINQVQINGVAVSVDVGIADTGTQRVSLATNTAGRYVGDVSMNGGVSITSGTITTVGTVTTVSSLGSITTAVVPGTAATNLGKAEDAAHGSGNVGVMALAVRNDAAATTFTSTDGDYCPISTSNNGEVFVTSRNGANAVNIQDGGNSITVDGAVTVSGTVDVSAIVPGTGATNLGKAEDAVHASGDVGVMALGVSNESGVSFGANGDYTPIATDRLGQIYVNTDNRVLFRGRSATFRTPGRAGTAGQKIMSLHNATGSSITVNVTRCFVDLMSTVVKAITVPPPIVRLWKVTVLPTNGTALSKTKVGGSTTSNASITVLGDASADGTGSGTTLTATLPAGTFVSQEFAPRFVTAAGYEPADRIELLETNENIQLGALEGLVVFLDYTGATSNPTTDMWIAGLEWEEL